MDTALRGATSREIALNRGMVELNSLFQKMTIPTAMKAARLLVTMAYNIYLGAKRSK